jgi:hypothetical protein
MADDGRARTTSRVAGSVCCAGRRTQSKTLDRETKSRPLSHPAPWLERSRAAGQGVDDRLCASNKASGLTLSGGGTDSGQRERGVECGE